MIFYIIPELIIVCVIFGVWKIAYDAKKNEVYDHRTEFQTATAPLWMAVLLTIAGICGMLGIAAMWDAR